MAQFAANKKILLDLYNRCELCGDPRGLEVHHKIPRTLGGPDDLDNLIVICGKCHAVLHNGTKSVLIKIGQSKARYKSKIAKDFYEYFDSFLEDGVAPTFEDVMDFIDEYEDQEQ